MLLEADNACLDNAYCRLHAPNLSPKPRLLGVLLRDAFIDRLPPFMLLSPPLVRECKQLLHGWIAVARGLKFRTKVVNAVSQMRRQVAHQDLLALLPVLVAIEVEFHLPTSFMSGKMRV